MSQRTAQHIIMRKGAEEVARLSPAFLRSITGFELHLTDEDQALLRELLRDVPRRRASRRGELP